MDLPDSFLNSHWILIRSSQDHSWITQESSLDFREYLLDHSSNIPWSPRILHWSPKIFLEAPKDASWIIQRFSRDTPRIIPDYPFTDLPSILLKSPKILPGSPQAPEFPLDPFWTFTTVLSRFLPYPPGSFLDSSKILSGPFLDLYRILQGSSWHII